MTLLELYSNEDSHGTLLRGLTSRTCFTAEQHTPTNGTTVTSIAHNY